MTVYSQEKHMRVRARGQGWGTIYYKSTTDVLQDVRRVWNGYRSSYDPCDPVV